MNISTDSIPSSNTRFWCFSALQIFSFVFLIALLIFIYQENLFKIVQAWDSPEYSHAYLIPFISLFIVWQNYSVIKRSEFKGAWLGVLVLLFGSFMLLLGELSTLYIIVQYSFLVILFGLVLSITGISKFTLFLVPLFLLFFTIPLPSFLYNGLSSYLQLISSKLGVEFIRLFGISVHLEGNVIDLGVYQLQVVEACNGLRYLFPLVTLSVIASYFYNDAFWKKVVIVLSSLPITVIMNSIRIGVIGILVEHWGIAMAEGFLHDFEGWIVFMICFAILLLEMWLLSNLSGKKRALSEVLNIEVPAKDTTPQSKALARTTPVTYIVSSAVILLVAAMSLILPERQEDFPDRQTFASFPQNISGWVSQTKELEVQYINALKFEDYLLANYAKGKNGVELYIAYYDSQRKGESAHSPSSCLPGAGWRIEERAVEQLENVSTSSNANPIRINKTLVSRGDDKFFMYYWFKQRDRHIANEYLVKWFLFWDALTKNRTDGALIRIIVPVNAANTTEETEVIAKSFLNEVLTVLPKYVPD